jgi:hypothetical protein
MPPRVFLLSPARLNGERARLLFEPVTLFPVARALRSDEGAPLGEVFSFLSGLYFRGKLAYAEAFARPPAKLQSGVFVITTNRGLAPASNRITLEDLAAFAAVDIRQSPEPFRAPLERDAEALAQTLGRHGEPVLLGSIATAKYVDALMSAFGKRLLFPAEFVGRGDMSRGGLMLRCVEQGTELTYMPVQGAIRRGTRPPKLPPRHRID